MWQPNSLGASAVIMGREEGEYCWGGLLIVVVLLSIVFVDGHGRDAVGGGRMLLIYDG